MPCLKRRYQQGQAVLIVLLVAAVALGFGLSIISRSTTDVKISEQEDQASRAFNAAEAGIEAGLNDLTIGTYSLPVPGFTGQYSVASVNALETTVSENDIATVALGDGVQHTLTIEWVKPGEDPGTCSGASGGAPASLLITVINNLNEITREGWNACNPLNPENGFTYATVAGDDYLKEIELTVAANVDLVRIRPIYNQASIRVTGDDLPVQAYAIDSRAQSLTLESKAIQVSRTVPATPAIFDYVLFSGTNIVK